LDESRRQRRLSIDETTEIKVATWTLSADISPFCDPTLLKELGVLKSANIPARRFQAYLPFRHNLLSAARTSLSHTDQEPALSFVEFNWIGGIRRFLTSFVN
jgi:hypothetical protein